MATAGFERESPHSPVFGREDAVAEISRVLAAASSGTGQGLLLTGAAGIGKSHLLQSAVDRAASAGFHVLSARALPEDLPPPFTMIRQLLASAIEEPRVVRGSEATEGGAAIPMYLLPFLGGDLGEPAPRAAEGAPKEPSTEEMILRLGLPGVEPGGQGHQELIARVAEFLRQASRTRPLLLAFDDVQFTDTSSLEVIERLAGSLADVPLAIVATVSEQESPSQRTRALLDQVRHAPDLRTITLRPFGPAEVAEFVRWAQHGRPAPDQDVLRWHAQTEGNPLFLEQVVRTTMGFGPPGAEAALDVRNIADVLRHRLDSVDDEDRRLLSYAVVLGKEFAFADLLAVAGTTEERGTEGLDRLVRNGFLRERGGEVYEFVSEALRSEVYAELTETRRRILHRKAARALESRGASDYELARHFFLGREEEKAVEYNSRAAQAAARAFDFDTAAAHVSRALEAERRRSNRDPDGELQLLIELGRLLDEVGNLRRSEEVLQEAIRLARGLPGHQLALGRALLALAQTHSDTSEYATASELAQEAVGILALVGSARDLMAAHRVLGTACWRLGRPAEAEAHQREALLIARREGTPSEVGHTLIDLANSMIGSGPVLVDTALELYDQAADLFGSAEDHASRARVLMNRAVLQYSNGGVNPARGDLARAIESAERSRSPIWIGYCHLNLAQIEAEAGRIAEAHRAHDRALEALRSLGDRLANQQLAMTRGMIAVAEKAWETADHEYAEALAQARSMGMIAEEVEVLTRLAHAAHARGDDPAAREFLAQARARWALVHRPDLSERIHAVERTLPPAPPPQG
jgi:tetratricopeptide (TPR) repeat protein